MDMCEAFIAADIPLYKLENPKFSNFLKIYTKNNIPHHTTLRGKYTEEIYTKLLKVRTIFNVYKFSTEML